MSNLCIVGLGMIGGSLAAALKKAGYQGEITALVRRDSNGERGVELGFIDRYSVHPQDVIETADMVMLAVPMLSMREQMIAIREFLKPSAVVTDAGSVKGPFIEDAREVLSDLTRVVPGHPIAGREKTGVDASDATLYQQKRVLLTPLAESNEASVNAVQRLWEQAGAMVEHLDPKQHDRVLAATSHLPHVVAFALVDALATQNESEEIFRYAAGGFKDFTRIASSDAVMWRDVCLTNRDAILASMDNLDEHMKQLRKAIESGDSEAIERTFVLAKKARDENT